MSARHAMFLARLRAAQYVARGTRSLAAGAVLVALCAVGARAEEESRPGWTVGLDAGFEVFTYDVDSSVMSAIAPEESGAETKSTNNSDFKFGLEVMTPAVESWLGRPRLFAGVGGQAPLGADQAVLQIALLGDPGRDIETFEDELARRIDQGCVPDSSDACPTADPEDFRGQGSQIGMEFRPLWFASLGVAINFDLPNDFLFRLKPSVEYAGGRVNMEGELISVLGLSESSFSVVHSTAGATAVDHRIGPGIEGELVISRSARPVALSMYVDARFLWIVSDNSISFTDPAGIARYTVERGNALSAGAGVRLTWMAFER